MVFDKSQEVFGGKYVAWIGINDKKTEGEFVYTSSGEKINFSIWGSNQPDNTCGWAGWLASLYYNEPCLVSQSPDCAVIGYKDEKWHDGLCLWQLNFICEIIWKL